ncbi:hypothetical protein RFI_03476 [Reticulomyxa filosa]|uniref:UDENN domain-containing protein n=1 Tax=Reticulomyxa filosa TaxID=46433 RepID=X6P7L3_RETFI|nr:hypothetical protein RFI_03476 [Reticulomyxa filosa]|eukprot:ETO33627.1 hypothetical protein RFI_03476 [Reticulomyxa filosa]
MPRGARARTRPPPPAFFTFTGWNSDGSKLYGAGLEVFEKLEDLPVIGLLLLCISLYIFHKYFFFLNKKKRSDLKRDISTIFFFYNQTEDVYVPKALAFVSHYPYFFAFDTSFFFFFFMDYNNRCLWHVIPKKLIRLEDLLMHYFYDIPAPQPGKKIAYDLGRMRVLLACPNEFDIPIMELPSEILYTQLSKDRICMAVKLLLLESRVMIVCADLHNLTPICELLTSLIFPLRWRHLYIPQLCRAMVCI